MDRLRGAGGEGETLAAQRSGPIDRQAGGRIVQADLSEGILHGGGGGPVGLRDAIGDHGDRTHIFDRHFGAVAEGGVRGRAELIGIVDLDAVGVQDILHRRAPDVHDLLLSVDRELHSLVGGAGDSTDAQGCHGHDACDGYGDGSFHGFVSPVRWTARTRRKPS
ncbi:hypothetical protein SDC9_170193 [bioreactor metagenome]|uniref:Uncharacterized protein n=1 Tax=bioreactor metagenome TaxID=1076179 RepID=A0A645GAJ2_9ZZZZ